MLEKANTNSTKLPEVIDGSVVESSTSNKFSYWSTEELKQEILRLTTNTDTKPLSQKVQLYKNSLSPLFAELSQRNPFPKAEDQVPVILGAWTPIWSTIPFQDLLPGRIRQQSYQIFHGDGYYANIARYAPGHQLPWLQKLSSILLAYDLMLLQKFEVVDGQWHIQNLGIKQGLSLGLIPLSLDRAEEWFTNVVDSNLQADLTKALELKNLDETTAKKLKKSFLATPQLEHLYIDHDFRLVKSQREAKQRPSYTVGVRLR